jgi:hypothetical protein
MWEKSRVRRKERKEKLFKQEELGEIDLRSDFNFNLRGRKSFK